MICKHYKEVRLKQDDYKKSCEHYQKYKGNYIGFCMLKMKNTFLCHYSEFRLGIYTGDSEILKSNDLI